jgi:deoxycytidylate deaminase
MKSKGSSTRPTRFTWTVAADILPAQRQGQPAELTEFGRPVHAEMEALLAFGTDRSKNSDKCSMPRHTLAHKYGTGPPQPRWTRSP